MAEYTVELREFFEQQAGNSTKHSEMIENGREKLFNFDYPIFDEEYKKVFETHFIRKFYMREIGFETFGLFKFQLETWLLINMPYWNKIFESELLQYDPLTNAKMDVRTNTKNTKKQNDERNLTSNRTAKGNTTGTSESTNEQSTSGTSSEGSFSRQLESNNPDTRLAITTNNGQGVIQYASEIKEDVSDNSKTASSDEQSKQSQLSSVDSNETDTNTQTGNVKTTVDDTEDFISNRVGKIGVQSYPKMIAEYRASLLRVENMIFEEMNQLFMLVY